MDSNYRKEEADKKTQEDIMNKVNLHIGWLSEQEPNSNARLAYQRMQEAAEKKAEEP